MYSSDFTFICLTDTWLADYVCDGEILRNDYVLNRKDQSKHGGGVLIAVKSCIPSSLVPSPPNLEVISVELGIKHDFVLCSVYIPPDSPAGFISSLVTYLNNLVSSYEYCIFVGDFNLPEINWSSLSGPSLSFNTFCEFVFDCNLTQHVSRPTHMKGNILDLVLTSPTVTVENTLVNPKVLPTFTNHFVISYHAIPSYQIVIFPLMFLISPKLTSLIYVHFY